MIRFRANAKAAMTNAAKIAARAISDVNYSVKQYVLTIDPLGTITSITAKDRDGNNVVTAVSGITDKKTLREALVKAINNAGGFLVDGGLDVTVNATAYTIKALGEVPLVSLENGATRTFTVNATSAYNNKQKHLLTYAAPATITVNGVTTSLGTIASGTATAGIKTAIDTATGATSTVTADPTRGGFIVELTAPTTTGIFMNGKGPYSSETVPAYTT